MKDGEYCHNHDPARQAAKEKRWRERYDAEEADDRSKESAAKALAKKLGVGHPHYSSLGKGGHTGNIVLEPAEVEKILARLTLKKGAGR